MLRENGGKNMELDEIETNELIEAYKKIEDFISFLEKEENSNM